MDGKGLPTVDNNMDSTTTRNPEEIVEDDHGPETPGTRRGFPPIKLAAFASGPVATLTALGSIPKDDWEAKQFEKQEVNRKRKLTSGQPEGQQWAFVASFATVSGLVVLAYPNTLIVGKFNKCHQQRIQIEQPNDDPQPKDIDASKDAENSIIDENKFTYFIVQPQPSATHHQACAVPHLKISV